MSKDTIEGYAIWCPHMGLYYNVYAFRNAAIAHHVWAIDQELFDAGTPFNQNTRPLNARQKQVWAEERKKGRRAVKVIVTTAEPQQ